MAFVNFICLSNSKAGRAFGHRLERTATAINHDLLILGEFGELLLELVEVRLGEPAGPIKMAPLICWTEPDVEDDRFGCLRVSEGRASAAGSLYSLSVQGSPDCGSARIMLGRLHCLPASGKAGIGRAGLSGRSLRAERMDLFPKVLLLLEAHAAYTNTIPARITEAAEGGSRSDA